MNISTNKSYPVPEQPLDNNSSQKKMLDFIGQDKSVVDFGCATGYLARLLTQQQCIVTGIEIDPEAAKVAEQYCHKVIVADLDFVAIKDILPEQQFDVAVFGDVLEHLRDPWRLLRDVKYTLKPDGYIVASIPNIAHGAIRLSLLQGKFEYTELGILDNTHLRFFTRKTVEDLIENSGYLLKEIEKTKIPIFTDNNLVPQIIIDEINKSIIDRLREDEDIDTLQFIIKANQCSVEERQRILRDRNNKLCDESQVLKSKLRITQEQLAQFQLETERISKQLAQSQSETNQISKQLAQFQIQNYQARDQLTNSKAEYQKICEHLEQSQSQLQPIHSYLDYVHKFIREVEKSKFWQIRNFWFDVKSRLKIIERDELIFHLQTLDEIIKNVTLAKCKPPELTLNKKIFELEQPKQMALSTSDIPLVSIVIPVYNKYLYTYNCLSSLQKNLSPAINIEIIIIDDSSIDETSKILQNIQGIKLIRNPENLGFIRSCNAGILAAKGEYICLLNNDTQVLSGWLENLLSIIIGDETVGAVGSKLVYPDGHLQEAGGIIWQDANGWNYGRFADPNEPEYNYVREVDYCSGASLLVRKTLLERLGNLSEEFLPAYYEDVDLCFGIRQLGYKVLYQPQSIVIHHEGISSGTDIKNGIKKYQEINRDQFRIKWQAELAKHLKYSDLIINAAARRLIGQKTILIIDSYVPIYDREAGSLRLLKIIQIFKSLGYALLFLPDDGLNKEPYTSKIQQLGVEVLYNTKEWQNPIDKLQERLSSIDIAWVCRPNLCSKYLAHIRKNPQITVIYDTIDLHFVRLKREWELSNQTDKLLEESWQSLHNMEINMAKSVELTVVVTEIEKDTLKKLGVDNISVIPTIHDCYTGPFKSYEQRDGLLFIGGYQHTPNVDTVMWLCQEIMPIIWQKQPEIVLTLLGSNPPQEVVNLQGNNVRVTGYIQDVETYFLDNRVFVAPIRFGAGIKGKLGQSLSYGLPSVTTDIGAEGMGLTHNLNIKIGNTAREFAAHTLNLYNDASLWNEISKNALEVIQQYSYESIKYKLKETLEAILL